MQVLSQGLCNYSKWHTDIMYDIALVFVTVRFAKALGLKLWFETCISSMGLFNKYNKALCIMYSSSQELNVEKLNWVYNYRKWMHMLHKGNVTFL